MIEYHRHINNLYHSQYKDKIYCDKQNEMRIKLNDNTRIYVFYPKHKMYNEIVDKIIDHFEIVRSLNKNESN